MSTDILGIIHVLGEVKNTGSSDARSVEVVVTLRDGQGHTVATAFGFTSPNDLSPGGTGVFDVINLSGDAWGNIASFEVQVQLFLE